MVLQQIVDAGQMSAAKDIYTYDHRSLWQFTAALDKLSRLPLPPEDELPTD